LREAAFLEAEAREREAEADAKSTRWSRSAIAEGDIQAVQFFLGQKYIEALQSIGSVAELEAGPDAARRCRA
jgi:hypothetical protein